jgi:hypothetical protein
MADAGCRDGSPRRIVPLPSRSPSMKTWQCSVVVALRVLTSRDVPVHLICVM